MERPVAQPTPTQPNPECGISPVMGCAYAEMASDRAVEKTFAILGVDIHKPESVEEFREDLRFGKSLRKMANRGAMAAVVVIVGCIVSAIGYGLREMLLRGGQQ